MSRFIKLTSVYFNQHSDPPDWKSTGDVHYVNASSIRSIEQFQNMATAIYIADRMGPINVKETPQEIIRLINE